MSEDMTNGAEQKQEGVEERRVITLEKLLVNVRDKVGEVQRKLVVTIDDRVRTGGPLILDADSLVIRKCLPPDYLAETEQYIFRTLVDMQRDPLIVHHEDKNRREAILNQIQEVARAACILPLNMTWRQLAELSGKAKQLYEDLLPIAEESRMVDHRTGLKISDHLIEKSFEYLKQYIAEPHKHISFVYIDLNDFKLYNDFVGWQQADVMIEKIAAIMKGLPEGVTATRKNDKRGDEFLLCAHADSEGAYRIMQRLFMGAFERDITGLVRDEMVRSFGSYSDGYESCGGKLTCSIGISSTQLAEGAPNIFARAAQRNKEDDILRRDLDYIASRAPEDWHDAYIHLNPELRKRVLVALRKTLLDEAEDAAHLAKKQSKDTKNREFYEKSNVRVYDPGLPKEAYVYISSR